MINVTIKTLDGRNSAFELDDEITVEDFKQKIEAELNIPVAQQRLIFQGRVLQDSSKLQDHGVQDKVIHLVPRPPPSTREQTTTVGETSTTTTTTTGFTGFPWGGIDMQQAIQDITTGIFTGLGTPFQVSSETDLNSGSQSRSSIFTMYQNTFNRLHDEATGLLQSIMSSPASSQAADVRNLDSPSKNKSDSSTVRPLDSSTVLEGTPNGPSKRTQCFSGRSRQCDSDVSASDSSPMHIDGEQQEELHETSQMPTDQKPTDAVRDRSPAGASSIRSSSSVYPLSSLADMLARHRQLWRSAEPYFNQWEAMINNETRVQQQRQHTRQSEERNRIATGGSVPNDSRLSSEEIVRITNTRAISPPSFTGIPERLTNSSEHIWHQPFFQQLSRLLHLHAHMLHLISDFNITSVPDQQPRAVSATNNENVGETQRVGITDPNATQDALTAVPVSDGDVNASLNSERVLSSYPRRVLSLPGCQTHYLRTSVNVEPISVTGLQASATTVDGSDSRSRTSLSTPIDRRRSQSASVLRRDQTEPSTQGPRTVTTGASRFTGFPATTTAIRGGSIGTDGAAVVHRVDIPIISMNMINLPLPGFLERIIPINATSLSNISPTSGTSVTTTISGPTTTLTPTITSSAVPIVSETQMPSATAQATPGIPRNNHSTSVRRIAPIHTAQSSDGQSHDPFLLCHSWHFTAEENHVGSQRGPRPFTMPFSVPTVQLTTPAPVVLSTRVTSTANASPTVTTSAQPEPPRSTFASQPTTTSTTTSISDTASSRTEPSNAGWVSSGLNLPQQIALFVSAATNAAASAASAGGLHASHSPFNVLVSSTPMQFTVDAPRQNEHTATVDSGLVTSAPRMTVTDPSLSNLSNRRQHVTGSSPAPAWADIRNDSFYTTDQLRAPQVFTVFTESLVEAVWLRFADLAREQGVNIDATFRECLPSKPVDRPAHNQRVSAGFLHDVISAVESEMSHADSSELSQTFSPDRLDGMRTRLSHLLFHADTAMRRLSENCLTDGLINLLFGRVTDGDVPPTADSLESRLMGWVCSLSESDRQIIDVRASLARVFRMRLSSLLDLWRNSPFNFGFGSGLMMALPNFCVYLLCMIEVLAIRLAAETRLPTQSDLRPNRATFDVIIQRLQQFVDSCDNTREGSVCQLMSAGVQHCINLYCNYSEDNLRTLREHMQGTFVLRRLLPAPPSTDVEMEPRRSQLEQCIMDDADLDDLPFLDASSELPINNLETPLSGSAQSFEKLRPSSTDQSRQRSSPSGNHSPVISGLSEITRSKPCAENISPLPDGTPKPGDIPESLSQALDPHPDSARMLVDATITSSNLPNPEGWHAVLPSEWLHVVAGDMATMDRSASAGPNPLDQFRRFSDAYIAGMPAKRRKVMEDNSRSIAQPPDAILTECLSDAILTECLSDAIRVSGCKSTADDVIAISEHDVSRRKVNLVLSLRELVTERIARRLSSDPDFDPTLFPLSNEAFIEKRTEKP